MDKEITPSIDGVKVFFSGEDVKKENIIQMVQNCQRGKCDCMSDNVKEKITDMQISGQDGAVNLHIAGDITTNDLQNAINKSSIINNA